MKKVTISISYDEEKLSALKLYLDQKQMQVEDELTKALAALYCINVPAGVRDYFFLRAGPQPGNRSGLPRRWAGFERENTA